MKDGISRSVTSFRSKTGCDLLLEPRPDIKIGDLYVMKAGETDLVNVYTNLKNVIKPRGSTGTPLVIDTIKSKENAKSEVEN